MTIRGRPHPNREWSSSFFIVRHKGECMADENVVEGIKKETQDLIKESFVQEAIKNNEIHFEIDGVKYRAKRPSFEQKQKVITERTKRFVAMLKNPDSLMEKDLIKVYESRGISIQEINNKIDGFQVQRDQINMVLGKLLTENRPEVELLPHKQELEKIADELNKLLLKKSSYLESSVESQMNVFTYVYMGALITERQENVADGTADTTKWIPAWKTYDDFTKEPEIVVNQVVWYSSLVSRNDLSTL